MKRIFTLFAALLMIAVSTNAQTVVKGDMNDDGQITVVDVTSVANVAVGRAPMQTLNLATDPYAFDNTSVVGTWYAPDGSHFSFNADGTTDYPGGATYEFYPSQGHLLVYDATGLPVIGISLWKVTSAFLLAKDSTSGAFTFYTNSASLVSSLTMSETSLAMNSGTTQQLSVTVTPPDALNPGVTWSSSDESVATVDASGLVTAVAGGTATITATAADGSGKTATCQVTVTQLVTSITLSQTSLTLEIDGYKKLTATVLPANASNKNVTWSSSNENVAVVARNGGVTAIGYGTCAITCTAQDGSGVSATCEVRVVKDESGTINGRDYIDLDLPSGTLWATMNVGASSPEDYGLYFAWGDTQGYTQDTSDGHVFDWSTYKYCNGTYNTLTKYCYDSSYGYNGFTDTLTELEPADDAATANWGSDWRMPSLEQFTELINSSYTTTTWTIQNGVEGRLITSKSNGHSIFLPAAGCRDISSLYYAGSNGYYCSRTLNTSSPNGARDLYFDSSSIGTYRSYRYYGRSVRPVRVPQ